MKNYILIIFFLFDYLMGQTLKEIGNRLYYQKSNKIIEVMRFEDGYSQGYDILDSMHIFIAQSCDSCDGAATDIKIYDLETGYLIYIDRIGGTGDSEFRYNKENNLILFNWYNGINVFKLPIESDWFFKIEPQLILEIKYGQCYSPFWIDSTMIGYKEDYNINISPTKYIKFDKEMIKKR